MLNRFEDLPSLGNDEYKPIYVQLSDAIILYIKNKNLKPGAPLPSETYLISKYGVCRQTVRIAFQRLATEGLIKKIQGKGTFVSEPERRTQIRGGLSLENSLVEKQVVIASELLEASVFREPIQLWLDELNLPAGSSAYKFVFRKIVNQIPIGVEVRYLPVETGTRLHTEDLKNHTIEKLLSGDPETEACRIKYRVIGEFLMERYTDILKVPEGSPGLVQFETHYNRNDKPVMTGKMILLSERVELSFELRKETNIWINQQINHELRTIENKVD